MEKREHSIEINSFPYTECREVEDGLIAPTSLFEEREASVSIPLDGSKYEDDKQSLYNYLVSDTDYDFSSVQPIVVIVPNYARAVHLISINNKQILLHLSDPMGLQAGDSLIFLPHEDEKKRY